MQEHTMEKEHILSARGLSTGYDGKRIVTDLDMVLPKGKISVIIGANGCGKSTLLKTFTRLIRPMEGEVALDGVNLTGYPTKALARELGLLPQSPIVPEGITVSDLVARGRYPYGKFMKGMTTEDFRAVEEALSMMGITELADTSVEELSGGQRQRVWIALSLAQETDILLLDEPTTYLDIAYQVEILDLLTDLNRKRGTTIAMVLHDVNLSVRYADYIFAMKKGRLAAAGSPRDILTADLMKEIYGLDCVIMEDPTWGGPMIIPRGRHHSAHARNAQNERRHTN